MDCNNYEDKIMSFIENELSVEEKADFQLELNNNSNLRAQYNEMKKILVSLNKMPKIETSSNFIVDLNAKIDCYESKSNNKIGVFLDKIINYDYLPQISIGVASLVCLFVITFFWSPDSNGSQIMLSNSALVDDLEDTEIANLDSLDNEDK
tara:strand:+ start:159 stop:611 length:453 start_codon:yes stop_codon:yes gene_type:complete